jgi:hypothetical protein
MLLPFRWPPTAGIEDGQDLQHITPDAIDEEIRRTCYDELANAPQSSSSAEVGMLAEGPRR